jgi:FkbM family methyltransferase
MIVNDIDIKTKIGATVGEIILTPLSKIGVQPKIIDLGARSGMFELPESYTSEADFCGFEPNKLEYEKLISGRTDSMLAGGRQPRFKTSKYFPTALWSSDCERELCITVGPGACSLSGGANTKITRNMYLEGRQGSNYQDSVQEVKTKVMVPCSRLDSLMEGSEIIDYLKVDVEGSELEVFLGAEKLLASGSVLLIKAEFLLTPYYANRVLLGHQHVFLDKMGYRLIDFDLNHLRYLREPSNIPKSIDRRPVYAGDAFFILDPDLNDIEPIKRHRLGIILLTFGFKSLAMSMMRSASLLSANDLNLVEDALTTVPLHKKLKAAWMSFPYKVWPMLKKLGLFRVT